MKMSVHGRTDEVTVQALRGIDFRVRHREVVATRGPSGCG